MNHEFEKAEFQRRFAELLQRFERTVGDKAPEPYAGAGVSQPLEHTTRINFLNSLFELLGWKLGLDGNMVEEARLKDGTTTFMDYLGVAQKTNAPVLLIEAKAWDKPFIKPARGTNTGYEYASLIAQAIEHWRNGGERSASPAVGDWHDYIEQVGSYVKGLWERHNHPLPRAVITSGKWIVVFKQPMRTFVTGPASGDDIKIFQKPDYCGQAGELYDLLSKLLLCRETPYSIRPTEVQNYITPKTLMACFHALHLNHEISGSPIFARRPRIQVYPAIVLRRDDGALLTVLEENPLEIPYKPDVKDLLKYLELHFIEVKDAAEKLLKSTGLQLDDLELHPSALNNFPGYQTDPTETKSLIKKHASEPDVWVLVTGSETHFLRPTSDAVCQCQYHQWGVCRGEGAAIGSGAVSMQQTSNPRSFFTDDQSHHCAHQKLHDRRKLRCQIYLIDERLCCKACVFTSICWPGLQQPPLPCDRKSVSSIGL